MVGVFIFPAKPTDKAYPYKKSPKTVLEDSDENVALNHRYSHYYIHWVDDEIDKMDDNALIQYMNEKFGYDVSISSRHSGKGYNSEDKASFVRIIHNKKEWFHNFIG